ncbi:SRPBCC family protein [Nodosilinea sp. LEGE 06152]|uniref:SRPBCC family protein n=1 Tax=Nodosilinea sp. LEGE 06152 TaxID=2777966 RepID=UPI00188156AB|nr:SRPBCC family protein [Nodosilinea sp. LEGE 06152]MBE9157614.1 SRPBCC family protein [Nodosilinea sp. LEGE 06152]
MENSMSTQTPIDKQAGDLERWASIIGGGAMVLTGLQQRSLKGILTAVAGGGLVYQGTQGKSTVKQVEDAVGLDHAIRVEKTVTINRSAADLYSFWRNLSQLPTFMRHLKSVQVIDDRRSHWVANAPMGQDIEWDAVIVNDEPNRLIAWTSTDDAPVENSGFVRFQPSAGDRGTEVKVVMEYQPPGGMLGTMIAKLFGEEPEQQIGDELSRFKQLMEAGEIATTEGQPKGA